MLIVFTLGMHYPIRITYERANFAYFRSSFSYNMPKTIIHTYRKKYPKLLRQLKKPKVSRSRGPKRSLRTIGTKPL